jgi:hypothetical protein
MRHNAQHASQTRRRRSNEMGVFGEWIIEATGGDRGSKTPEKTMSKDAIERMEKNKHT